MAKLPSLFLNITIHPSLRSRSNLLTSHESILSYSSNVARLNLPSLFRKSNISRSDSLSPYLTLIYLRITRQYLR